jgi:hypothetical protein
MAIEPNENAGEEEILGAEGEEAETTSAGADDEGEGAGEGEGEGEGADGADEFALPEKFKGKTAEEIAKSYAELEGMIEKKATEKARDMIGKKHQVTKDDDAAIKEAMKGVDFSKMAPEEFAQWLIKTVESRAQEIARNTYDAADNTKTQVQNEINVVTKEWPALKENEGFRNIVLALIENRANKGEILTLKEACVEAGKAMGIKAGAKPADGAGKGAEDGKGKDGEGTTVVRPKTGVERQAGAGGSEKETDEEKVLAGLAPKAPGSLGGLY